VRLHLECFLSCSLLFESPSLLGPRTRSRKENKKEIRKPCAHATLLKRAASRPRRCLCGRPSFDTMSSPLNFTPWRRRALSTASQQDNEQAQLQRDEPSTSPPHGRSPNVPIAAPRPSSISSAAGHREPIRSFIHGSVRDSLGLLHLVCRRFDS
jgi:hypothetical protein